MNLRFAREQDIPAMISLLKQVGEVHHRIRPDIFRTGAQKYDEAALTSLLQDATRPIFIAAEGENVLGYCFCILRETRNDPVLEDERTLYIDDLCVDEQCRGQHVGKALYDHACAYARQQGCRTNPVKSPEFSPAVSTICWSTVLPVLPLVWLPTFPLTI